MDDRVNDIGTVSELLLEACKNHLKNSGGVDVQVDVAYLHWVQVVDPGLLVVVSHECSLSMVLAILAHDTMQRGVHPHVGARACGTGLECVRAVVD